MEEGDREKQIRERWKRIRGSRFCKWYGKVKGKGILEYLKKEWGEMNKGRWGHIQIGK